MSPSTTNPDRDDTIRNWARQSFTDPELHVHPL